MKNRFFHTGLIYRLHFVGLIFICLSINTSKLDAALFDGNRLMAVCDNKSSDSIAACEGYIIAIADAMDGRVLFGNIGRYENPL